MTSDLKHKDWQKRTIRTHHEGEPYTIEIPEHTAEAMGFHEVEIDTPKGKIKIDVPTKTERCDEV